MELVPGSPYRSTLGLAAAALVVAATAVACPLPHRAQDSEKTRFMAENAAAMDGRSKPDSVSVDEHASVE